MDALATIFNLPLTRLCFASDVQRLGFSRFFLAAQAKSATLLSLKDIIERYRCSSYGEMAAAFPELWKEAAGL